MKKVKTLLVTAIAALSLSSCSFQDVKDWASNAGDNVSGFFTSLLEKVGLKKKEEPKKEEKKDEETKPEPQPEPQPQPQPECEHQDANHDGVCDLCGETGLAVNHVDENHDHVCDVCEFKMSEHVDEDGDFKCDYCEAALATVSVELDTSKVKTEFAKGEEFSYSGLKVIATSEVGSTKELTDFEVISQPDMSEVGEKTIEVKYGEGEEEKLSYIINVSYWSEDDLEMFELCSYTEYAPLPYLAGFNMRTEAVYDEDTGDLLDWWIAADDITDAAYLKYFNALSDYQAAVELYIPALEGFADVYFELQPRAFEDLEGIYDLENVNVFGLVPVFEHPYSPGSYLRAFSQDEYFLLGINEDGQLIIRNLLVNNDMDDDLFDDAYADGTYGTKPENAQGAFGRCVNLIKKNYSELSSTKLIYPSTIDASAIWFEPTSWFSVDPFGGYDELFDYAWEFKWIYNTTGNEPENDLAGYKALLLENGFEFVEEEEGSYYLFYDELYGAILVSPFNGTYEIEGAGSFPTFGFDFFYMAPEDYTCHLTPVAMDLVEELSLEDAEIDNSYYPSKGSVYVGFEVEGSESLASGEAVLKSVAGDLLKAGLFAAGASQLVPDEDGNYYAMLFGNADYKLGLFVDEEATEGSYYVTFQLFDGEFVPSRAEAELLSAYELYYDVKPLKGYDYTEDATDGSFATEIVIEDAGSATYLQYGAEFAGNLLSDSFVLASSEAGENSTWVAVFNDVQRGVQVTSTSSIRGSDLVISVTFAPKVFVTPESVMVDFLTAQNGSAPVEGTDYTLAQDGSCAAEFAIAGEFTTENFLDEVKGLLPKLGEGFVIVDAQVSGNSCRVIFDNETTNIRATVVGELGESGISCEIATGLIPVPCMTPLEAITALNSKGYGATIKQGNGYYYMALAYYQSGVSIETLKGWLEEDTPAEFTCVADWEESTLSAYADWCGVKTGAKVDKFEATGLTPVRSSKISAPLILESPVNIECKVKEIIPLGSHDMFLSEIVAVDADKSLFNPKTNALELKKANLVSYSHGNYFNLGKLIGKFGFSVEKKK